MCHSEIFGGQHGFARKKRPRGHRRRRPGAEAEKGEPRVGTFSSPVLWTAGARSTLTAQEPPDTHEMRQDVCCGKKGEAAASHLPPLSICCIGGLISGSCVHKHSVPH